MRRVLKYTNAFAGLLLIAALGGFYKYVWQSMPVTAGEIELDVSQPVTITRDDHGIPHIQASTIEDAIYAQGFVHAQDRFWQMEATRRIASGEMSEIVGAVALESDIEARKLRLRRTAIASVETLNAEDRKWFAAYARGVNDWLNANLDRLPLEIRALNYTPVRWSMSDSMLLGLHMYRQLSTSWTVEADELAMLSQGNPDKVKRLFPTRSGMEIMPGSNAWALAGSRTVSGKPILAGDPHLQQSWPSTFYINHLKAEDLDVIGGSIPGSPAIIIGHNQKVAWSMTTLHFDVQDLYFNENTLLGTEKELIQVKGARPFQVLNQITPHGPLVDRAGRNFALKWSAYDGRYEFPFLELNRSQNWRQFRAALKRFPGPNHNFLYADSDGNIGYQAAGRMPLRKTLESSLPLDAANPENEWNGYIPFEEMPTAFNPKGGVIVNANQNPFPADYRYPVAGIFTPPYRQQQIAARLEKSPKWRAADMTSIQKDVYSSFHHFLAKELAKAGRARNASREEFATALEILEQWNGQMEIGQSAPMITSLAYEELKRAVMRSASPNPIPFASHFAPAIVEDLLRRRPKEWFPDYDQLLVQTLLESIDQGAKLQGKNPRFWDYGRFNRIWIPNQVLGQAVTIGRYVTRPWMPFADSLRELRLPLIDNYVEAGPAPLSGATQTVKQVSNRVGPAFRFIADTADWDNSSFTLTLGQSGHAFAKHSKDYWDAYYTGGAVPLPYKTIRAESVLRLRPKSSPKTSE